MPHFVVTYVHPNPEGWARHLEAHLRWILEQKDKGALHASGPTTGRDVRTAMLVFTAPDENSLRETLSTDPYLEHGQVSELTITQWDPIFGVLADKSSRSALTDAELFGQLLKLAG